MLGKMIFCKNHRKVPVLESLFNKVAALRPAILLKETPALVLPCGFCKVFKNTRFAEHLRTTASLNEVA